jgi:CubicO group peptidase (beta-lactamase class C family)
MGIPNGPWMRFYLAVVNHMRTLQNTPRIFPQAFVCLLGILLLAGSSAGQRDRLAEQGTSSALRQAISDAAKKYKIPGIAAALIDHGQLRAVEVFGVRDQKSGAPVTANTIFEAGSLGEPLYAYSVLLLAANGRFNPGAPLPSYLPLPYLRDLNSTSSPTSTEPLYDPQFNQITAIRVMNHTSGMPDWARGQHLRLTFAPGQKWSYSNEGYLYLQNVVEHVAGESFESFVARGILGPARMSHSSFVWREAYAADMATGIDRTGAPIEIHKFVRPAAASTLYTSIRDYAQFVTYILASAPAQRAHESAVSLMLNSTVSVNDAVPFSWGLGVGLEKIGDDLFFFHRENSPGFQCFVMASRKAGSGVVIFTNSGNGLDAMTDILAATIGGNHPILKSNFVQSQ